ncbi:STAS domain-containing protein [candidate division TA06 bacterium]|nr:STAS domain-containing protein [candidate division TA06 bacterium]
MLRITRIGESLSLITLKVEGQIISEWVPILEKEALASLQNKEEVVLDFSEVTFINQKGVEMLKKISAENIRIINCSPLIQDLLNGGDLN